MQRVDSLDSYLISHLGTMKTFVMHSQTVKPAMDSTLGSGVRADAGWDNCCGCCLPTTPPLPLSPEKRGAPSAIREGVCGLCEQSKSCAGALLAFCASTADILLSLFPWWRHLADLPSKVSFYTSSKSTDSEPRLRWNIHSLMKLQRLKNSSDGFLLCVLLKRC